VTGTHRLMQDRRPGKRHSVGQRRDHLLHSSTGRPQPNQNLEPTRWPARLRPSVGQTGNRRPECKCRRAMRCKSLYVVAAGERPSTGDASEGTEMKGSQKVTLAVAVVLFVG